MQQQQLQFADDALGEILSFLPAVELYRTMQVSKQWNDVSRRSFLWQNCLSRDWLSSAPSSPANEQEHKQQHHQHTDNDANHNDKRSIKQHHSINHYATPSTDASSSPLSPEDDKNDKQAGDPKLEYTTRFKLLKSWSKQWETASLLPFQFFITAGFNTLMRLLFSVQPINVQIPHYLHKSYMDTHVTLLRRSLDSARFWLTILSIVLTCMLVFAALDEPSVAVRLIVCSVLVIPAAIGFIASMFPFKSSIARLVYYACMAMLSIVIYFCVCAFKDQYNTISLKAAVIFVMSVLHAMDQCVPRMLFETFELPSENNTSNATNAAATATTTTTTTNTIVNRITASSTRNYIAQRYYEYKGNSTANYLSLPLSVCAGIIMGTGGLQFLAEIIGLIIILLIKSVVGVSITTSRSLDSAIPTVIFYSVLGGIGFGVAFFIYEKKMQHSYKLRMEMEAANDTYSTKLALLFIQIVSILLFIAWLFTYGYIVVELQDLWNLVAPFQVFPSAKTITSARIY